MNTEELIAQQIKEQTEKVNQLTKDYQKLVESSKSQNEVDLKLKEIETKINTMNEAAKSDFVKAITEINEKAAKQQEILVKQAEQLQSIGETSKSKSKQSEDFKDKLKNALLNEKVHVKSKSDFNDEVLSLKEYFERSKDAKLFLKFDGDVCEILKGKAAVDMTQALSMGSVDAGYFTFYKPDITLIPLTNNIHAISVYPVTPTMDKNFAVVVEHTYWDGSGIKTEGSSSAQSSVMLKTVSYKVFTIATYFKLSDETLADVNDITARINRIAPDKINSNIDSKIWSSLGDNSTAIKGAFHTDNCNVFNPATYASTVESCNEIDVIAKAALDAEIRDYIPNFIILNKKTIEKIAGLKDKDDNSILDRRVVFDSQRGKPVRVCGLTIINNDNVTLNQFFIGDLRAAEIGLRQGMEMVIERTGTDLIDGLVTIRFTTRLAFAPSAKDAFVFCEDIATAKTTLETT